MSKVAEQKALEEYPIVIIPDDDTMGFTSSDRNEVIRFGYIKGYDQAMQDFLEKAEEFFYEQFDIHPHDCHVVQYVSDTPLENMDDFIEQFKNYMQDESEK